MMYSQIPSLQFCADTTYYYDRKKTDSHIGFRFGDSILILGGGVFIGNWNDVRG